MQICIHNSEMGNSQRRKAIEENKGILLGTIGKGLCLQCSLSLIESPARESE